MIGVQPVAFMTVAPGVVGMTWAPPAFHAAAPRPLHCGNFAAGVFPGAALAVAPPQPQQQMPQPQRRRASDTAPASDSRRPRWQRPQQQQPHEQQQQQQPRGQKQSQQQKTQPKRPVAKAVAPSPPRVVASEVLEAVDSLYADRLRPYGRILRKRLAELAEAAGRPGQEADMDTLEAVCRACPSVRVQQEAGGEWSVLRNCREEDFVDVYCPEDSYPEDLWHSLAAFFAGPVGSSLVLPGGRYAAAQAMRSKDLEFLRAWSLGELCHVMQLAISQKKILGYLNGTLVPYGLSQSAVKEQLAAAKQKAGPVGEAAAATAEESPADRRCATWAELRAGLMELIADMPAEEETLPLSNLKRDFHTRFGLELSETRLGHAKLSELMQDPKLHDLCSVRLQRHGYALVPTAVARRQRELGQPAHPVTKLGELACLPETPRSSADTDLKQTLAFSPVPLRRRRPAPLDDAFGVTGAAGTPLATGTASSAHRPMQSPFPPTPSPQALHAQWMPILQGSSKSRLPLQLEEYFKASVASDAWAADRAPAAATVEAKAPAYCTRRPHVLTLEDALEPTCMAKEVSGSPMTTLSRAAGVPRTPFPPTPSPLYANYGGQLPTLLQSSRNRRFPTPQRDQKAPASFSTFEQRVGRVSRTPPPPPFSPKFFGH